MTKLFIPTKIRVGFQDRSDTFTGKLAYVIYYDEKGKIRKEVSWNGWCDKKIPALEFENTPRNNYVFNKGIKRYGDWGSGRSVIRVYDPRDFEFEISVDNLIGILMHSDVSKRDIVEECVFAWAGPELVLLPINSEEYKESVKYTDKQSNKISAKDLKPGHVYAKKKSDEKITYIGYYPYYELASSWYSPKQNNKGKRHVFHDGRDFIIPSVGTLSHVILDEHEDFAELVDKFFKSSNSSKYVNFETNNVVEKPSAKNYYSHCYAYRIKDKGNLIQVNYRGDYSDKTKIKVSDMNFSHFICDWNSDNFSWTTQQEINKLNNPRMSYNYHYQPLVIPEEIEFREFIKKKHANIIGMIPIDDVINTLKELGYGKLQFITESGNKTSYKG